MSLTKSPAAREGTKASIAGSLTVANGHVVAKRTKRASKKGVRCDAERNIRHHLRLAPRTVGGLLAIAFPHHIGPLPKIGSKNALCLNI